MANLLDVLDNADGSNTLYYDDGSVVVVSADGTLISSNLSSSFFYGTQYDDNLIGTKGADIMYGLAGSDLINAKDGTDLINGGSGSDTILGGDGADTFIHDVHENFNNTGIDFINAGKDTDKLVLDLSDVTLGELAAMGFNTNVADPSTVYADFRAQILAYFNSQIAADPNVTVDFSSLHINLQVKGVEILVVKTPPDARASSLNMDEDHVGNGAFDYSDPDGDIPKVVKINDADITVGTPYTFTSGDLMGATITVNANGTYALNLNGLFNSLSASETVTTTFTFTVIDDDGAMDTAIATVVIQGLNDGGVISGQLTGQVQEDLSLTASGVATIADADAHDAQSFVAGTFAGQHGSLQLDANGTWTYTLNNAAAQSLSGTDIISDTIQIQAQSGTELLTHDLVISIAGNNDAATISGNLLKNLSEEGGQTSGTAQINDVDINDARAFIATTTPLPGQYGTLTMDAQGHWVYTLNPLLKDSLNQGENFAESFLIQAQSGPDTMQEHVTINLIGQNDAPTAGAISLTTDEDNVVGANLRDYADDADSENDATDLIYNITQPTKGSVTLDANGNFTFNPGTDFTYLNNGQSELVNFTYTATDFQNATTTGSITIEVHGITNLTPLWTEGGDGSIVFVAGVPQVTFVDMNTLDLSLYSGVYDSLGGDDVIKLPDQANFTSTGFNPSTVFNTGSGADLLVAGTADSTVTYNVNLGTGNDEIHLQAGGHVLDGGADTDMVAFDLYQSTNQSGVNVKLSLQASLNTVVASNLGTTFLSAIMTHFENVVGSNYNDTITGDGGNNILVGLAGNDNIGGDAGNDTIYGNGGTNTLSGDAGNDLVMITNISVDTINGGADTDTVSYAQFKPGSTYSAAVQIVAGATAGSYNVTSLDAGLTSAMVHQTITNVEQIIGSKANDTYVVAAGTASDYFDGNDGADTVSFANSTASVTLDFGNVGQQNTGGSGLDTYRNVENVVGSAFNDVFISANNTDNNVYNGGSGGMDTVSYVNVNAAVTVNLTSGLATGAGNDTLIGVDKVIGSRYNDNLTGTSFINNAVITLMGGDGDDTLIGGKGFQVSNTLDGGNGNDMIESNANDTITGGAGNDVIKIIHQPFSTTGSLMVTATIDGGSGFDVLDLSNALGGTAGSVVYSFASLTSTVHDGTIDRVLNYTGIEGVIGTTQNDTFIMNGIGALPYARVDGGAGSDTVDYSGLLDPSQALSVQGVFLDLNNQGVQKTMPYAAAAHYETIQNIENVIGTSGIDFIVANSANNTLIGGLGSDTVSYRLATSAVFVNLASDVAYNTYGSGVDFLSGFQRVIGSNNGDVILGPTAFEDQTLAGRVHVYDGGGGNDTLIGHSGPGTPFDIALLNDNIMYYRFVQSTQGLLAINNWTGEADTLVYMDGVMAPADPIGNRVPTYQIISATPFVADSDAPTDTVGINSSNLLQLTANFDTNFNPFYNGSVVANGGVATSYAIQIGMISYNPTTGQMDYFAPVTGGEVNNFILNTITPNKLYVGYNNAEGINLTKNVFHDNGAGIHDAYLGSVAVAENEVVYSNHTSLDVASLSLVQLLGGINYFALSFNNGEVDYLRNIQTVVFTDQSMNLIAIGNTQIFTNVADNILLNNVTAAVWAQQTNPYDALGGDDIVAMAKTVSAIDTLWDDSRIFHAGAGNDQITGGDRNDVVDGGIGNDTWHLANFDTLIQLDIAPTNVLETIGGTTYRGVGIELASTINSYAIGNGLDSIISFERIKLDTASGSHGALTYDLKTSFMTELSTDPNNSYGDNYSYGYSPNALLQGTSANEIFIADRILSQQINTGGGENIVFATVHGNTINGEGNDLVTYSGGVFGDYTFSNINPTNSSFSLGKGGFTDTLTGVEQIHFGANSPVYNVVVAAQAVGVTPVEVNLTAQSIVLLADLYGASGSYVSSGFGVLARSQGEDGGTYIYTVSISNSDAIVFGGDAVATDGQNGVSSGGVSYGESVSAIGANVALEAESELLNGGDGANVFYAIFTGTGNDVIHAGNAIGGEDGVDAPNAGSRSGGTGGSGGIVGYNINAGDGNDTIYLGQTQNNGSYLVNTGAGNDTVVLTDASIRANLSGFDITSDYLDLTQLDDAFAQNLVTHNGLYGTAAIIAGSPIADWQAAVNSGYILI